MEPNTTACRRSSKPTTGNLVSHNADHCRSMLYSRWIPSYVRPCTTLLESYNRSKGGNEIRPTLITLPHWIIRKQDSKCGLLWHKIEILCLRCWTVGVLCPGLKRGRSVTLTTHPIYYRGQEWATAPLPLSAAWYVQDSFTFYYYFFLPRMASLTPLL
jgi:hypothetical protein